MNPKLLLAGIAFGLLGIVIDFYIMYLQFQKWGWTFLWIILAGIVGTLLVRLGTYLMKES